MGFWINPPSPNSRKIWRMSSSLPPCVQRSDCTQYRLESSSLMPSARVAWSKQNPCKDLLLSSHLVLCNLAWCYSTISPAFRGILPLYKRMETTHGPENPSSPPQNSVLRSHLAAVPLIRTSPGSFSAAKPNNPPSFSTTSAPHACRTAANGCGERYLSTSPRRNAGLAAPTRIAPPGRQPA